ncbi:hypothetical protein PIB30_097283, partial [Stylosanthes scabra]|nr:hypothetical protein [Stylosanthes scabra]
MNVYFAVLIFFSTWWRLLSVSLTSMHTSRFGVYGKSFNHSARDAWELFQSTGVEALVAYDCSGAIMLMGTLFGGLITGTCAAVWAWIKWSNRAFMIGSTSMLMGMVL